MSYSSDVCNFECRELCFFCGQWSCDHWNSYGLLSRPETHGALIWLPAAFLVPCGVSQWFKLTEGLWRRYSWWEFLLRKRLLYLEFCIVMHRINYAFITTLYPWIMSSNQPVGECGFLINMGPACRESSQERVRRLTNMSSARIFARWVWRVKTA